MGDSDSDFGKAGEEEGSDEMILSHTRWIPDANADRLPELASKLTEQDYTLRRDTIP
jgi:hypothetical protein